MPSTPVRTVSARWIAIIGALVLSAFGSGNAAAQSELHPYSFVVQVEGRALGTFRKVDGLSVETEVIEFREGGGNTTVLLPGNTKYSIIKLSRAFTGDSALWDWYTTSAQLGHVPRVRGFVSVMGRGGRELARFSFVNAWPRRYEGPSLNADSNDVPLETIEIAHEGLTLTTGGDDR
jgi:phage tail-like protein